ncbi:DUF2795 domain-containing protein [Streptosporangium sp. G11]|uniref:DUF2795 domain-containing protein n=1 Tax=Streptosporangium sp. G11 TaxID=3436926 RepID=UPI003EBC6E1B
MERGSAKHGPRLDDEEKHETEGMVRGGGPTHAEEWTETEPLPVPGEEGLTPPPYPPGREPGSPEGLSPEEVELRSTLAIWISGVHAFPAERATLLARAKERAAPDSVIATLRSLPDATFGNLEEVMEALGYGTGQRG